MIGRIGILGLHMVAFDRFPHFEGPNGVCPDIADAGNRSVDNAPSSPEGYAFRAFQAYPGRARRPFEAPYRRRLAAGEDAKALKSQRFVVSIGCQPIDLELFRPIFEGKNAVRIAERKSVLGSVALQSESEYNAVR